MLGCPTLYAVCVCVCFCQLLHPRLFFCAHMPINTTTHDVPWASQVGHGNEASLRRHALHWWRRSKHQATVGASEAKAVAHGDMDWSVQRRTTHQAEVFRQRRVWVVQVKSRRQHVLHVHAPMQRTHAHTAYTHATSTVSVLQPGTTTGYERSVGTRQYVHAQWRGQRTRLLQHRLLQAGDLPLPAQHHTRHASAPRKSADGHLMAAQYYAHTLVDDTDTFRK